MAGHWGGGLEGGGVDLVYSGLFPPGTLGLWVEEGGLGGIGEAHDGRGGHKNVGNAEVTTEAGGERPSLRRKTTCFVSTDTQRRMERKCRNLNKGSHCYSKTICGKKMIAQALMNVVSSSEELPNSAERLLLRSLLPVDIAGFPPYLLTPQ